MEQLELEGIWVSPRASGGSPVPETKLTRPFHRMIKEAGIAHFMPHDILHTVTRHTTAMSIAEFGVGKVREGWIPRLQRKQVLRWPAPRPIAA
jgi:hypothetical protein